MRALMRHQGASLRRAGLFSRLALAGTALLLAAFSGAPVPSEVDDVVLTGSTRGTTGSGATLGATSTSAGQSGGPAAGGQTAGTQTAGGQAGSGDPDGPDGGGGTGGSGGAARGIFNAFDIRNSKDGTAILTLSDMLPGESASETVTITNAGHIDADVAVAKSALQDTNPTCAACKLSAALELRILDVTNPRKPPRVVYDGKLGAMPTTGLGVLLRGDANTYSLTVAFPDGGPPASDTVGDNRYQGASASVDFVWTGTQVTGRRPAR